MGRKKQGQKTRPQLDAQFITRTGSPKALQRQVCSEESTTQMHLEKEQSVGLKTDDSKQKSKWQCKRVLEKSGDGGPEKLKKMKPDKDIKGSSSERFSYSPSPLTMEHLKRMGGQMADRLDLMIADRLDQIADSILERVKCLERMVADC